MAPKVVLVKKLTQTDVEHRLSYPTRKLDKLPQVEDEREAVNFEVRCGDKVYIFGCTKRKHGALKPVIEKGWSKLVRERGIQVGDILELYMETTNNGDHHEEEEGHNHHHDHHNTSYWIEVRRCVEEHQDEMGTTIAWHRIV